MIGTDKIFNEPAYSDSLTEERRLLAIQKVSQGVLTHRGTLMLADISGFTKFVRETSPQTGVHIIRDLLTSIIYKNEVGLHINEIEGDAVLFYKPGPPVPLPDIICQFESMSAGFNNTLTNYNTNINTYNLSLKVIVHYGLFATYEIEGFTKLYGTPVIEAHRLLKNSIDSNQYLLVTQNYIAAAGDGPGNGEYNLELCEMYKDIGGICYRVIQSPVHH